MPEKETAFVLPETAASAMEFQVFAEAPELGSFFPGEPRAVSDMGHTASEVAEFVKRYDLPLKRTTGAPSKAGPATGASAPSADATRPEGEPEGSPMPGLSKEEFDAGLDGSPVLAALAGGETTVEAGPPEPPPKPHGPEGPEE